MQTAVLKQYLHPIHNKWQGENLFTKMAKMKKDREKLRKEVDWIQNDGNGQNWDNGLLLSWDTWNVVSWDTATCELRCMEYGLMVLSTSNGPGFMVLLL